MLVARLHAVADVRIHDEPDPEHPPAGWSVVQVTSVGLCGSDLHWFTEGGIGENYLESPVVPGHEFAGRVLTGPSAGQRVAVDPAIPCGSCEVCAAGHGNLCPTVRFAGHGDLDGALQEKIVWPDHLLVPIPDTISDDAAALLEPLGVAIHAVGLAHVRPGGDILVVGAGPIGILAAVTALRAGARRVFVSEPLAHRRATAAKFGVDGAWAPDEVEGAVDELTSGRGVDAVIELAGTDPAIATAVATTRPGARVVLAGIPGSELSAFPAAPARRKGLTFAMSRRMHNTYPRAIDLASGDLDLDALVSARFPLARAADAFSEAAKRGGDKVVVAVSATDG
jgi:L-iditol 2-dehydrogenase